MCCCFALKDLKLWVIQKIDLEQSNVKKVVCVGNKKAEASPANLRSEKIKKRKSLDESTDKGNTVDPENYNFIMNFAVLKALVCPLLSCPECNSRNVELSDELSLRMGYAHKLEIELPRLSV